MAQRNRGRVSVHAQAALSGSHRKAPGSAGGYYRIEAGRKKAFDEMACFSDGTPIDPTVFDQDAKIRSNLTEAFDRPSETQNSLPKRSSMGLSMPRP